MLREYNTYVDFPVFMGGEYYNPSEISTSWVQIEEKISSFELLKDGWDYGRGGPIEENVRILAIEWCRFFSRYGIFKLNAIPGSEGQVSVSASYRENYIEIITFPGEVFSVAWDVGKSQKIYDINLFQDEAVCRILSMVGEIWSSSTIFTQTNTMPRIIGGVGWPSQIILDHFQLYPANVSRMVQDPYVTMLENTTRGSLMLSENPLYFSDFGEKYFRQIAQ